MTFAGVVRQYPGSDAAGSWGVGYSSTVLNVNHHLTGGNNAAGGISGGTVSNNTNVIVSWSYNTNGGATPASRWQMRKNAGAPVTESTSNTSSGWGVGNGQIGLMYPDSGYYFSGLMFEIVIAGTELITADRERVEGYLAHRWGLTADLPGDHPYKTTPPSL
jgi:hypothetical protein